MSNMLNEVCREINNWFEKNKVFGIFTIENGTITPSPDLSNGQYYRIIDSIYNDGIHQFGVDDDSLIDESFDGAIWVLGIPPQVVELANDIASYDSSYGTKTPYASESFAGYTYSKIGAYGYDSAASSWQSMFKRELRRWRKL